MNAVLAGLDPKPDYAMIDRSGIEPGDNHSPGVAWPAIFAGVVAALAMALVLITLGSGFGLAAASPWSGSGAPAGTLGMAGAIWLVVLYWLTSGLGGYLTGRLRTKWAGLHTHEVFFRDTANGFIMWSLATVSGALVLAVITVFTISGASVAVSDVMAGAARGAAGSPQAYVLDTLFRADHPAVMEGEVRAQSGRILLNAARTGEMPAADKATLSQAIAAVTGIPPADATKRVDTVLADANAAKLKAKQAADAARKGASTISIFTGLAMLIGAFVACVGAALGGQQRDDHKRYV